jgi:hypothetical protein
MHYVLAVILVLLDRDLPLAVSLAQRREDAESRGQRRREAASPT